MSPPGAPLGDAPSIRPRDGNTPAAADAASSEQQSAAPAAAARSVFKAVIFDLDNTLADATLVGREAFEPAFEAVRQANAGHLTEAQLQCAFDACWHTAFYTVAAEHDFSPEMTEAGAQAFRHLAVPKDAGYRGYDDLPLVPLLPLSRYLVTSGFRGFQDSKVDALGIREHFDGIEVDDPEDHLPAAGPGKTPLFEKIRAQQNWGVHEIAVVGDNPHSEIAVGNRLGMTTVQVLRPRVEPSAEANYRINDLSELWATLGIAQLPPQQVFASASPAAPAAASASASASDEPGA